MRNINNALIFVLKLINGGSFCKAVFMPFPFPSLFWFI